MNEIEEKTNLRQKYLRMLRKSVINIVFWTFVYCSFWLTVWNQMGRPLWFALFCVSIWLPSAAKQFYLDLKAAKQFYLDLKRVLYIPTVIPEGLPISKILVRASQKPFDVRSTALLRAADEPPVAQSAVLLRAAQAGQETPKEELLRGNEGE